MQSAMKTVIAIDQQMYRYTEEESIGHSSFMFVPSELYDEEKEILRRLAAGERIDNYETVRISKCGKRIYVAITVSPVRDEEGMIIGASTIARDITERKLAEEALSKMSRRLIEAHEEERTWIARELHDDINQRVALLAVDLERLKQNPPRMAELRRQLEERIQQLNDLAGEIQELSHSLHYSKLEYLGFRSGAAIFCTEVSYLDK